VHFHPAYLSRFFKKRTGLSLSEYMMAQRIERAKTLLIEPKLTVGHIVNRLGYDNSSHFSRTFKKMTGYTPLQFRKLYGNEKKQGSPGPFAGSRPDPVT
jgi:two-component system response regulator YesN